MNFRNAYIFFVIFLLLRCYTTNKVINNDSNISSSNNTTNTNCGKNASLLISAPKYINTTYRRASRGPAIVMRVIMNNLKTIREFYKKRVCETDKQIRGRIELEFTIVSSGNVIDCKIINSYVNDSLLESTLVKEFLNYQFEPVNKDNDTLISFCPKTGKKLKISYNYISQRISYKENCA